MRICGAMRVRAQFVADDDGKHNDPSVGRTTIAQTTPTNWRHRTDDDDDDTLECHDFIDHTLESALVSVCVCVCECLLPDNIGKHMIRNDRMQWI